MLSPADLARLGSDLEPIDVTEARLPFARSDGEGYVYFPETCALTLVNVSENGEMLEVGTVGNEGYLSLAPFALDEVPLQAMVLAPGRAHRVPLARFETLAAASPDACRIMLRYSQRFAAHVSQTAICNGLHLLHERLVRLLLLVHDRVTDDHFQLTHDMLASLLGVRRAGVTVAMQSLQDAGWLRYRRGRIEILDRAGLEAVACRCYRALRALAQAAPSPAPPAQAHPERAVALSA